VMLCSSFLMSLVFVARVIAPFLREDSADLDCFIIFTRKVEQVHILKCEDPRISKKFILEVGEPLMWSLVRSDFLPYKEVIFCISDADLLFQVLENFFTAHVS